MVVVWREGEEGEVDWFEEGTEVGMRTGFSTRRSLRVGIRNQSAFRWAPGGRWQNGRRIIEMRPCKSD